MVEEQYCQQGILQFRRYDPHRINIGVVGYNLPRIFGINRVLSEREALPLLDARLPSTLIPGCFIALCRLSSSFAEIVSCLSDRAVYHQVEEILRYERYLLRSELKRPWAFKTRRPFRGRIDRVTLTFQEKIMVAEWVINEIGPAWVQTLGRGRPMEYDVKRLSAIILVKGGLSFESLASELKNIGYDATLDGSRRSPCASYLHYIFERKIEGDWLNVAIKMLDEMSVTCYSKFDENLDVFVTDNASVSCDTLEIRTIAMTERLVKEQQPFLALTRNATNTVRTIMRSTNQIASLIPILPYGSLLIADGEFDVDENYWVSAKNGIELQVKLRKGNVRKPGRKKAKKIFDKQKYRKRKLGERFFGSLERRKARCYYIKPENRHKGMLLLGCEHNIIEWVKNKTWCEQFIELNA